MGRGRLQRDYQITTVGGGVVGVRRACNIRLWGWLMVSAAHACDTREPSHTAQPRNRAYFESPVGSSLQNHMHTCIRL